MHLFESALCVSVDNVELGLRGVAPLEWASFLLNPRRLRGSDFLMRWSQGVWSEERLVQAVNATNAFFAIPYGPSSAAPEDDVREFELYFERLEVAGLSNIKRPDLLVFRSDDQTVIENLVKGLGGISELPFTLEDAPAIQEMLAKAVIAVECENSLWKAKMMPDFGAQLRPQRRLEGKPGLKKNAVLPTVILKEEDRVLLQTWESQHRVPIHIWHVFYDVAYGLAFSEAQRLIEEGYILPTAQIFQAPGGATTKKSLYKFYYHYAYPLADAVEEPGLSARHIVDKNGHILPYVHFVGGRMAMRSESLNILRDIING